MGQIVIDIPNKKKRHYVFTNSKQADDLLEVLDASAVRVTSKKQLSRQQEDRRDYEAAQRNLDEMRRTEISYTVDQLREELDLA